MNFAHVCHLRAEREQKPVKLGCPEVELGSDSGRLRPARNRHSCLEGKSICMIMPERLDEDVDLYRLL